MKTTLNKLISQGYELTKVYNGVIKNCACGCQGDYYEYDDSGAAFNDAKKLMETILDIEIKDLYKEELDNDGVFGWYGDDGILGSGNRIEQVVTIKTHKTAPVGYRFFLTKKVGTNE